MHRTQAAVVAYFIRTNSSVVEWDLSANASIEDAAALMAVPGVAAAVDRQRVARPPLQISVPKGAVAIRDNRCWVSATTLCSASPKL